MFAAAGSSAAPRLRHSFLARALQGCVGTLATSVTKDVGTKAMLVCATVGGFLNELRSCCSARRVVDVLLPKAEEAWQLRFSASNRAHHIRSAGEILGKLDFELGVDGFSRVPLNTTALVGFSGAVRQVFASSVQCGTLLALASMSSHARQRFYANVRLDRWTPFPRSPHAGGALRSSFEAQRTVSTWHVEDVLLEVLQSSVRSVSSLSSLAPGELPPLSLFRAAAVRCRPWLAALLDCPVHALGLPAFGVAAVRARALFSSWTEPRTLDRLLRAAERSYLLWSAVAPSQPAGKTKAHQVSLIRSFVRKPVEAKSHSDPVDNKDFNVLCANIGTSRATSRVLDVFQTAQDVDASVVLLQEVRLSTGSQLPGLPPGWTCFVAGRSDSPNKGGGVAVAVRQPVLGGSDGRVVDVNTYVEAQWCQFRLDARSATFVHCASVYVPPSSLTTGVQRDSFTLAADALVSKAQHLVAGGHHLIIGGDFNTDLSVSGRSPRALLLRRLVLESGLLVANSMAVSNAQAPAPITVDSLNATASLCPPTHIQSGDGTGLRAAAAPSRLDWILVSPSFGRYVDSFEICSWLPSDHAVLCLRNHIYDMSARFITKQRVLLHVDLLSRAHVADKQKKRLESLAKAEEQLVALVDAERSLAVRTRDVSLGSVARAETILAHQLASVELQHHLLSGAGTSVGVGAHQPIRDENRPQHFATTITALLDSRIQRRFAVLDTQSAGVGDALSLDDAARLFSDTILDVATPLLSDRSRTSRAADPNRHANTNPNPAFRFEWWSDELETLHKQKKRIANKYGKQLQRNKRDVIVSAEAAARTETLRLSLRALEKDFATLVAREKRSAFAHLLRQFDSALDHDRSFPLSLWRMLSAMQRKKSAPNGSGSLISVDPKMAVEFWTRIWSDNTRNVDMEAFYSLMVDYEAFESVRESFSSYCFSQNKLVNDELCAIITAEELHACAISLATGKAPGCDGLPNDILRILSVETFVHLALICNRALFGDQRLPADWLRSQLKLLPKPKTTGTEAGDYRPICLLSCAFKLLETVLLRRFRSFCDHYDRNHDRPFLSRVQGGFRHARGTLDQVVHLLLVQQNNMASRSVPGNDGSGVIAVFLDIEKAFDSARHALVLQKLLLKGVPTLFVKWISLLISEHYCNLDFTGANFEVAALDDDDADPNPADQPRINNERGVIQGSIFGPLLWDVFSDDLIVALENSGSGCPLPALSPDEKPDCSSWFADDGGLWAHTCAEMQRQLDICTKWAEANRIRFSPRKSVAMWLSKPSMLNDEFARVGHEQLLLHGSVLSVVEEFCYLGIDIIGGGKATVHGSTSKIERATNRIDQLQAMLRSEHGLTPRLGLHVVRAKINSVLLYGCDVLPPHPQADIVQRKALRHVVSAYDRTHNWFLYSELGESRISTLAMVQFVSATARCISSLTPVACCLASLTEEVLRCFDPHLGVDISNIRSRFVPWQLHLEECLKTLLFVRTGDGARVRRALDMKTVLKLGVKTDNTEQRARTAANEQLSEKRFSVERTLRQFANSELFGLEVCKILTLICEKRLELGSRLASGDDCFLELRNLHKCVKALVKTHGLLYEHNWWCEEASKANWPLSRIGGPGEGQPYLTEFSAQHANIAFLFRTGSFNPVDVVARNGGRELRCRLCNMDRGDTPIHLLGICDGGGNLKIKRQLESLRVQTRAIFGDLELTDWRNVVYGLVGRTRGVNSRALSRERVVEGCAVLHDFYTLRRNALKARNAGNADA